MDPDYTEYTIKASKRADAILEKLRVGFGKDSVEQVFDVSVALLDWWFEQVQAGNPCGCYVTEGQVFRELVMPELKGASLLQ